jgi:hypothetical protein
VAALDSESPPVPSSTNGGVLSAAKSGSFSRVRRGATGFSNSYKPLRRKACRPL